MRKPSLSANSLEYSNFIPIHYIIEICWKKYFCGNWISGNINLFPHTLITVDAVSGCDHSLCKRDIRSMYLSGQAKI